MLEAFDKRLSLPVGKNGLNNGTGRDTKKKGEGAVVGLGGEAAYLSPIQPLCPVWEMGEEQECGVNTRILPR